MRISIINAILAPTGVQVISEAGERPVMPRLIAAAIGVGAMLGVASAALAADGHDVLRSASDWSASDFAPGKAYREPAKTREATGIGFGQNLTGGLNSNDATKVVSKAYRPRTPDGRDRGVNALRITVRDGTDESWLGVTVRDLAGRVVGREIAKYEGAKANGKTRTFVFQDIDRAGVTVSFKTGKGKQGKGNGFSWKTSAEPVCGCKSAKASKSGKAARNGGHR